MSINPASRYPTKTNPASPPEWPFGEPRNIATAGDGTGTPWEVGVVKDLFGMQQALLIRAGITPTGDPENADVSQYVDAMSVIFGRQLSATTTILTTTLDETTGVRTLGYAAQGDGGGTLWLSTGVTTPGKAGTTELELGFVYDADGRQFEIVFGDIDPRQFGAVGDGATDDKLAFQAASTLQAARGGGVVRVTPGRYFLDSQLILGDKVVLHGSGAGSATITFQGAAGSFPDLACIFATGSSVALPALSVDVDPEDTTLTFAAAHGLAADDLFYVVDPRNESYTSGSTDYRAGEFFVSTEIPSSTTVVSATPAVATTSFVVNGSSTSYDFTEVNIVKVTPVRCSLRHLTIEGISPTDTTMVVRIDLGRQCTITNTNLQDSFTFLAQFRLCYNTSVRDVKLRSGGVGGNGANGINLAHCQLADISYVTGVSQESAIFVSENSAVSGPVNRFISISHCDLATTGTVGGAILVRDNTEDITIADSVLAGIRMGGDQIRIRSCDVRSSTFTSGNGAISIGGITGGNVLIENCRLIASETLSSEALLHMGGSSKVDRPGTIILKNTVLDMGAFTGFPMELSASNAANFNSLLLSQVEVFGGNSASDFIFIRAFSLASWASIEIRDCTFRQIMALISGYGTIVVRDSQFLDSPAHGIVFTKPLASHPISPRKVTILSCLALRNDDSGITIEDDFTDVFCAYTTSLNNNVDAAKSNTRSSFVFNPDGSGGAPRLVLQSNVFGDDQIVQTQTVAYFYTNLVDFVEEAGTIILGGLPVSRGAVFSEKLSSVWDTNTNITEFTGRVGVSDGDISNAPANADDLVVGKGSGDHGIYIESGSGGESRLTMGDTGTQNRFELLGDHANGEIRMRLFGVTVTEWASGVMRPLVTGTIELGVALRRWQSVYGGRLHGSRLFLDNGTILVPATHLALGAGFGVSASASNSTGRDSVLQVLVDTGGSGTSANPIVTYTYPSGTTPTSKVPFVQVTPFGTVFSDWQVKSATSTSCEIQFKGTPAISTTYGVNVALVWADA